ncbi:hypothetical protein ACHHYP_16622 [Achlya hypogyna]|uniref:COMM domain-containing protein n=1 Tax=Achlya hypogyna TaxID=1202772 RepID=A0A1V9Y696_ACHHY|nr:hypothetical protein ACHHYP_16622 [Achlya hypogyna]
MALQDVSAMTDAMQEEFAAFMIGYALSPQDHDMANFATAFASAHSMNLRPLKKIIQDTVGILAVSLQAKHSTSSFMAALVVAGMSEATAKRFGAQWEAAPRHQRTSPELRLAHAELSEITWKLGVTTGTNLVGSLGTPFVVLTFALLSRGQLTKETMELSLPMFYQFLANMEALQAHMTYLQA